MTASDLVDLYSHCEGNNAASFRVNRNNAMYLVPHDRNLESIRENIAIMEAADRLLKDPNRKIPEHRRGILEARRAESEKNAASGIQNKWSHLVCPGTSEAHQWPRQGSRLEHHPLSSTAEPVGDGQKRILDQLGDRILHGDGANISPSAWSQIALLRREEGTTLLDLRAYFSATPSERSVLNRNSWLNLVRTGIHNGGLYVETQSGEANPPSGYDANWLAWAAPYKPVRSEPEKKDEEEQERKAREERKDYDDSKRDTDKQRQIRTELTQAGVAAKQVQDFMQAQGYDWNNLTEFAVNGTTAELASHVADISQSNSEGISISLSAGGGAVELTLRNMTPPVFKQFYNPAGRMLQLAEVQAADVTVKADAKGAREILGKLGNNYTARITATFQ